MKVRNKDRWRQKLQRNSQERKKLEKEGKKEREKAQRAAAEDRRGQRKPRRGQQKNPPPPAGSPSGLHPGLLPHCHLPPIQPSPRSPEGPSHSLRERFPFLTEPWRGASMNTLWMEVHKQLTAGKLRSAKRLGASWSVWRWCPWSHSWGFTEHVLFVSPAPTHRL